MTATQAPEVGPGRGGHGRRLTILAVVVLAFAAIVVPFGLRGLGDGGARATGATHATAPRDAPTHGTTGGQPRVDAVLGPRGGLPALLPSARSGFSDGTRVRLGDITDGILRRTPSGGWQILVRWNGRLQPVTTRGPVGLGRGPAPHAPTSWVSAEHLLYTRVATGPTGEFRVYAWEPRGGTAYTAPTLVATSLGRVCFNHSFTAFGTCRSAG